MTSSTETRLSQLRPALRVSHPIPPPSVKPPTPVWLMNPPGVAKPCSWVAASSWDQRAPPPQTALFVPGSTCRSHIGPRSIITASSAMQDPEKL